VSGLLKANISRRDSCRGEVVRKGGTGGGEDPNLVGRPGRRISCRGELWETGVVGGARPKFGCEARKKTH
jgi:hypothetical protein